MSNILITGITGFTGSHLAEYLLNTCKLYGTVRGRCRQTEFINHIKKDIKLLECDLTDYNSVQSTIEDSEPDIIYHLASQTFVPTSWRAPQETMNTNVMGTLNLLEATRKSKYDPKILIVGSSEEYGMVYKDELPIKETNPLRPLSPYAVSKIAQDLLGYQYYNSYGLRIIRTRCFNIMGPRSGEKIVTASFAKQFWHNDEIKIGNTHTIRDFIDVRDVVVAYKIAINKCNLGEVYNISTGEGHSIQEILDTYRKMMQNPQPIINDDSLIRPSDVPVLIGDSSKFREKTHWSPTYTFEKSLADILEYWRDK